MAAQGSIVTIQTSFVQFLLLSGIVEHSVGRKGLKAVTTFWSKNKPAMKTYWARWCDEFGLIRRNFWS